MPITQPDNLVLVTWFFGLNDGIPSHNVVEVAEMSVWGSVESPGADVASWNTKLETLAQLAADNWSSLMDDAHYGDSTGLTKTRAAAYNTSGHTKAEQFAIPATPWFGPEGNQTLPWQLSQVIGLYTYTPGTFIPNGRRRRGRVYLPPLSATVLDSGKKSGLIQSSVADDVLNAFNAILSAMVDGDVGLAGWFPGVRSLVDNHLYPLTDLTTDTKLDTQRRRTNRETAPRTSTPFSP